MGQTGHLAPDRVVESERPKKAQARKRSESPAAASARAEAAAQAADAAEAAEEPAAPAEPDGRQSPPPKRQRRSGKASARGSLGVPLRTSKRRGSQGGGRFRCSYCASDVSATSRIKCAECDNFDLCVHCFSVGVEVFPHKNSHKYRVVEHLGFEVRRCLRCPLRFAALLQRAQEAPLTARPCRCSRRGGQRTRRSFSSRALACTGSGAGRQWPNTLAKPTAGRRRRRC